MKTYEKYLNEKKEYKKEDIQKYIDMMQDAQDAIETVIDKIKGFGGGLQNYKKLDKARDLISDVIQYYD